MDVSSKVEKNHDLKKSDLFDLNKIFFKFLL